MPKFFIIIANIGNLLINGGMESKKRIKSRERAAKDNDGTAKQHMAR